MRAIIGFLPLLLAACGRQATKPDAPPDLTPAVVEVPVEVFVPIDPSLTERCRWRETAPLREIPAVANERKLCLKRYEANLDAISRVQGKPVPKPAIKSKK
jgi:hypothetical protein